MWVYQETETNAAALVPTLPEDTEGESLAEKEAMTPASGRLTEMPPQKAPPVSYTHLTLPTKLEV